jgi:hypothetical protein
MTYSLCLLWIYVVLPDDYTQYFIYIGVQECLVFCGSSRSINAILIPFSWIQSVNIIYEKKNGGEE